MKSRHHAGQIRELQWRHYVGATHRELAETYGLSVDAVDLLTHGSKRQQRRRWRPPGTRPGAYRRPRPRLSCVGC